MPLLGSFALEVSLAYVTPPLGSNARGTRIPG